MCERSSIRAAKKLVTPELEGWWSVMFPVNLSFWIFWILWNKTRLCVTFAPSLLFWVWLFFCTKFYIAQVMSNQCWFTAGGCEPTGGWILNLLCLCWCFVFCPDVPLTHILYVWRQKHAIVSLFSRRRRSSSTNHITKTRDRKTPPLIFISHLTKIEKSELTAENWKWCYHGNNWQRITNKQGWEGLGAYRRIEGFKGSSPWENQASERERERGVTHPYSHSVHTLLTVC